MSNNRCVVFLAQAKRRNLIIPVVSVIACGVRQLRLGEKAANLCFLYSRVCLISHRLIRYIFVGPGRISFVYISGRQFAQFLTSFYPLEAFCSATMSFAVSRLMFKQLVRRATTWGSAAPPTTFHIWWSLAIPSFHQTRRPGEPGPCWYVWEFHHIKDLYLRIVAPGNLFIEFIHEVRNATRLPLRERRKSIKFGKDSKGVC